MKKSYMNSRNILSEGFLEKIFKLFKLSSGQKSNISSKEKALLKNPAVKIALSNFHKQAKKTEDAIDKARKAYGLPPIDRSKY
jgi:hypothetical protein